MNGYENKGRDALKRFGVLVLAIVLWFVIKTIGIYIWAYFK